LEDVAADHNTRALGSREIDITHDWIPHIGRSSQYRDLLARFRNRSQNPLTMSDSYSAIIVSFIFTITITWYSPYQLRSGSRPQVIELGCLSLRKPSIGLFLPRTTATPRSGRQ
jgi:hypothetical protein